MNRQSPTAKPANTQRSFISMSVFLCLATSLFATQAYSAQYSGITHLINMKATNLPSGQLAYQMVNHTIRLSNGELTDVTYRYSEGPTIPGPTIVLTEGDTAEVTLKHGAEFGLKKGDGYYTYVASKFANDLIIVDMDKLACISHKLSTAEPQCHASPALHSIWVLNRLQVCFHAQIFARLGTTYPCSPSRRKL